MEKLLDRIKPFRQHLLIAAAAIVAHAPSITGGFAWDSLNYLAGASVFTPSAELSVHRPLYIMFLKTVYSIAGGSGGLYHAFNLLLHAINSVAVFILARRLLNKDTAAFAAGLLFALHPAAAGAVGWAYGGGALFSAFFVLVSYILYLSFMREDNVLALISSVLFYILACLSGPGAVLLPLAIVAHELLLGKPGRGLRLVAPAFALGALVYMLGFGGAAPGGEVPWVGPRLAWLGYYTVRFVYPAGVGQLPHIGDSPLFMLAGLVLPAAVFLFRSEKRLLDSVMSLFIFVMLLPRVMGVLPGRGILPAGDIALYIPLAGLAVLVCSVLGRALESGRNRRIAMAVLALLCIATLGKAAHWGDRAGFWDGLAARPGSSIETRLNRAAAIALDRQRDRAARAFSDALKLYDDTPEVLARVMRVAGVVFKAQEMDQGIFEAMSKAHGKGDAAKLMGVLYEDLYMKSEARRIDLLVKAGVYFKDAIEADPGDLLARYKLAALYNASARYSLARSQIGELMRLDKDNKFSGRAEKLLEGMNKKQFTSRQDALINATITNAIIAEKP